MILGELKTLAQLKVIALGCPMDGMKLESSISQAELVKFLNELIRWMVDNYFASNVHMPSDTADLDNVKSGYLLNHAYTVRVEGVEIQIYNMYRMKPAPFSRPSHEI
jgi:hypothetical protein